MNEFAPLKRTANYNGKHPRPRVGQTEKDRKRGRRNEPNVRVQGHGNVSVMLAKGGTVTLTESGRKNGNGAFFRLRDGACVSHKLAGGK